MDHPHTKEWPGFGFKLIELPNEERIIGFMSA